MEKSGEAFEEGGLGVGTRRARRNRPFKRWAKRVKRVQRPWSCKAFGSLRKQRRWCCWWCSTCDGKRVRHSAGKSGPGQIREADPFV